MGKLTELEIIKINNINRHIKKIDLGHKIQEVLDIPIEVNEIKSQLSDMAKQNYLTPVGFRDMNPCHSRSNTNQTGTTRMAIFQQFGFQDMVLCYANYWNGNTIGTPTPNSNPITIKASIEINGVIKPVFFKGKRTVSIDGGEIVYSDPIGCMVSVSDTVYIRTYFDSGVGGYIPNYTTFGNIGGKQDGIVYGTDLTDSGNVTNTSYAQGYTPMMVLGITKDIKKSYLLVGDSIITNGNDVYIQTGNTCFVARRLLNDKIGFSKISMGGEKAKQFLESLPYRINLIKNHSGAICNYGINDMGASDSFINIKSYLLNIWKYFATKGLPIYQCTYVPRTISTDFWLTNENQSNQSYEIVRLQLNAWLRDVSSNGAMAQSMGDLTGILDSGATMENNGKWIVFPTPVQIGTVQSAGTNYFIDAINTTLSMSLDLNSVIKITSGTGAGQILQVLNNADATKVYVKTNWTTIPDATSTYEIYNVPTQDGTHPTPIAHQMMSTAINVSTQ